MRTTQKKRIVSLPQERQQDTSDDEEHPNNEDKEDDGHLGEVVPILIVHEVGHLGISRVVGKALLRQ